MTTFTRIGVVGAGTIGRGVAHACALAGYEVALVDTSPEQLIDARDQIRRDTLTMGMLGKLPAGAPSTDTLLDRIETTSHLKAIADAGYVIENITEDWFKKDAVYRLLDELCTPDTIFGVNTSAVPITRIAAATRRPQQVIGVHFMNPVPLMDAVEVIRGHHTSDDTVLQTSELLSSLGKSPIVINDAPGFVTNRVLMATINEAIDCVREGTATVEQVDQICRECFGHSMGPLETADLIGLDTILNSITVMQDAFRDSKFRPSPLLVHMVEAGLLGRKTGEGFYTHEGERHNV
ncbi:3-hydroxyacyl-CoA dehydrogenase family protein [Microbacterium enclense]|uniref:3-hydroxyacyl-CoA dehydrogenase family protein n=1 Tax=Microbacterium enclense TaxID=993073 RepID=UPI003F7EED31